jgi:hypothetical protein
MAIQDIAAIENISDRFVGRALRLAYLAPAVLERLVLHRRDPALSIRQFADAAEAPWVRQTEIVFDG